MRIIKKNTKGLVRVLMLVSRIFLILALTASLADAKDTDEVLDSNPLRPADTSSPRDTLRSFLTNANEMIQAWRQGEFRTKIEPAYLRAVETLDLSTTPHNDSWETKTERALLLKEILDRIELPPNDAIPGDSEVSKGSITRWTIPDTAITIARVEDGPRAGQFLFSADTVQRLHRLFAQAKHLPYKSGTSMGFYEEWTRFERTEAAQEKQARNRLKPVDTSSPRSTLEGFLDSINRAYELASQADAALQAKPPAMTIDEAREIGISADNYLQRAVQTLDLSQVPEALREDVGVESALQLKEVFDRMQLPPVDSVPDAQMVRAAALRGTDSFRWRYPNTAIEIVEIKEGERQGQFLFSAGTVDRISEFYEEVRELPYHSGVRNIDWKSPNKSEGAYESYITTPGYLVPHAHFLGRLVDALPAEFKKVHRGQTLWQWVGLVLCVLAVFLTAYVIYRAVKRTAVQLPAPLDAWLMILVPIAIVFMVDLVLDFINKDINITGDTLAVVLAVGRVIIVAAMAGVVLRLFKAGAETIIALPRIHEGSIDATLVRLGARLVGFLLGAWILIAGVQGLGVDIVPLLAGLGVGGLAVALAARPTMENIIGSFMIFADKPYRIGQRIRVMGQDGTVESIGLRSTKIRLLSGHQTSIPNEKMATAEIENIGRRPYIRRILNVAITYDTSPAMINRAVEILREILAVPDAADEKMGDTIGSEAPTDTIANETEPPPHPNEAINQPDFAPRVYFNDLKADSLNILVIYWYHPPKYWRYLEHAQWINVQIMERFNAEGIDFAFPTQTLHLAGDDKRPLTVGQRWVSKDEELSHSTLVAQAAALGAQTALSSRSPARESVPPHVKTAVESSSKPEGELTDAPLEDSVLHGDALEGDETAPR